MTTKMPEKATLKLSEIVPWPGNPRKGHAVDEIASSVTTFNYLAPIIVQKGTNRIVAGHGRFEALKKLGVEEVEVLVADLSDHEATLYTLAESKIAEKATWDFTKMADLLIDFDSKGIDLRLAGFADKELEQIANWTPPAKATSLDGEIVVPAVSSAVKSGFSEYIGICFNHSKALFVNKPSFVLGLFAFRADAIKIEMPCGRVFKYGSSKDFPITDTPCSCGDKREWIVKWMET